MNSQSLYARKIPVETNILCDLQVEGHNRLIPKGKFATQIIGDETVKCQGIYHGKYCYDAALEHYEELKEKTGIKETSDE